MLPLYPTLLALQDYGFLFQEELKNCLVVVGMECNQLILQNMASYLILFSNQIFNIFPYFLRSSESLNMEQQLPGDVDAHEVKGFIQPIQKLGVLNILLGLEFSSHCHPKQAFVVQCYLHICPPINVIEGCKDSR